MREAFLTPEEVPMTSSTERGDIEKLASVIQGIGVAMLTTREDDGALRSRPMAAQEKEFDGILWFFTNAFTPKVHEVQQEQHVNVSYSDTQSNRYVSVSGRARLVRDRDIARELWTPAMKAWFPKGLEDPNLGLLRIEVDKAEYWDGPGSAVVQLVGFATAIATGRRYEGGEHEKVDLRT